MLKVFLSGAAGAFMFFWALNVYAEQTYSSVEEIMQNDKLSFWEKVTEVDKFEDRQNPILPPTADQVVVKIKNDNLEPDKEFLKQLATRVRREVLLENFDVSNIDVGRIDLNGDGRDELIVHFSSTYFCGTSPNCSVSVYHHDGKRWRYIGEKNSIHGYEAYFEKNHIKGWRIFKYGDSHQCWVTPEGIRAYYKKVNKTFDDYGPIKMSDNGIGQKIDPSFGGYLYLPGKETCNEE